MKTLVAALVLTLTADSVAVGAEMRRDIEYAEIDGVSLKLDASVPDGAGPFPVAILVHGGGWGKGDKAREYVPPTEPLTDAKFTWFSINYRLAPEHRWPACIEDVCTAIRWVKHHAVEYKGDPARIALIGYSAGGHLVAYASATADDDTRVQAVVVCAGPTDLVADCERRGGVSPSLQALFNRGPEINEETRKLLQVSSPINHLTASAPPCLLVHGTVDESVPFEQSVNYRARLQALGVPCELITIPGGAHPIDRWQSFDRTYQRKMVDWLQSTVAERE